MEEEKLLPEENCRAAAYYACRCIQEYINNIRSTCYPKSPEEKGGGVYILFLGHLEIIERLLNGDSVQEVIEDIKVEGEY